MFWAGSTQAETLRCVMADDRNRYYVAKDITLKLRDFGKVEVRDAIIQSTGREKIFGKIDRDDSKRLSIIWELNEVPHDPKETRAYSVKLVVRLTVRRSDGTATMTILDKLVRDNEYRATGVCRFDP